MWRFALGVLLGALIVGYFVALWYRAYWSERRRLEAERKAQAEKNARYVPGIPATVLMETGVAHATLMWFTIDPPNDFACAHVCFDSDGSIADVPVNSVTLDSKPWPPNL